MALTMALGLLAVLAQRPGEGTDTTFAVRAGTRLELRNMNGDIVVRTWDRNSLRIQAEHSSRERLDIGYAGVVLKISATSRRGAPRDVDYILTVPAAMDLDLGSNHGDISIDGSTGRINIETIQGDVTVRGGRSVVTLHSVSGDVHVGAVRGRLEASSTNGEVMVDDVEGEVYAETTNGDVMLRGIRSDNVTAATVNGDLVYRGTIGDNGHYRLSTHNGDVTVTVSAGTNATVTVSTFSGDFESDFPVTLSGARQGKRFSFTIGTGKATLELESYQGSIRLVRP